MCFFLKKSGLNFSKSEHFFYSGPGEDQRELEEEDPVPEQGENLQSIVSLMVNVDQFAELVEADRENLTPAVDPLQLEAVLSALPRSGRRRTRRRRRKKMNWKPLTLNLDEGI